MIRFLARIVVWLSLSAVWASLVGLVVHWAFSPLTARADDARWSRSRPAVILDASDFVVISGRTFNVGELLNQHEAMWQAHNARSRNHR